MIYNLLHSALLMKDSCRMFEKYCVQGLEANRKKIEEYVNNSLMLVTALSPVIGYDKSAKLAHTAYEDGTTLREACLKLGFLTGDEFDKHVIPQKMTHP
jgi:fumarate hydratase class II